MKNEKIIVARNYDGSSETVECQGVEVSIGCFTSDKSGHLKSLLQNDNLFEERTYNGNTHKGSDFLTDLMDVNENYHKNGMITYESEIDNDIEDFSTDNWCFGDYDDRNDKATKVVFDWEDDSTSVNPILKIPKEGFTIVSVRSESLYFYAEGALPDDRKKIIPNISDIPKFKVQPGIDTIWLGSGFGDFNILHSVFVDDEELGRNFEKEEGGGKLYYSTHLLLKDGIVAAWLATNNNPHFFPFGDYDSELSEWMKEHFPELEKKKEARLRCISPYLKKNDPEAYEAAVTRLLQIL